jgi:putative glutamine amidotransferase
VTAARAGGPPDARPLRIGVSACFFHPEDRPVFKGKRLAYAEESMLHWVASAGAVPLLVPTLPAGAPLGVEHLVDALDGLLLHGGADVCPRTYGQEPLRPEWEGDAFRDAYELALVHAFTSVAKPVLGICRGIQLLNVACGGTLWQDLPTQVEGSARHRHQETYDRNLHQVDLLPGTSIGELYGLDGERRRVTVNSVHHQAVRDLGDGLVVEAVSADDGIVEAVRLDDPDRWVRAVQWHPEFSDPTDSSGPELLDRRPLMAAFLDACRARQELAR